MATFFEKSRIFLFSICFTTVVATDNYTRTNAFGNPVCTEKECVVIAYDMFKTMNEAADPCNNFEEFACGKYEFYQHSTTVASLLIERQKNSDRIVKKLIKEPIQTTDDRWINFTKTLYQKCETKSNLPMSRSNITEFLKDIGGFPLFDRNWKEFNYSVETYMGLVHRIMPIFWQIKTKESPSVDYNVLTIIPQEINGENAFKIFRYFTSKDNDLANDLKEAIEFGQMIDKVYKDPTIKVNSLQGINLAVLMKNTLQLFDINEYLTTTFDGIAGLPTDKEIHLSYKYMIKMFEVLKTTPKKLLANWVGVTISSHIAAFNDLPSSSCQSLVTELIEYPLARMYIKNEFNTTSIRSKLSVTMEKMLSNLIEMIKNSTWMEESTRKSAIKKIENLEYFIGFPDHLFNDTYMNEEWNITLDPSDFFEKMMLQISKEKRKRNLLQVVKPVDMTKWYGSPTRSNAFYMPYRNKIFINAAILGTPFYAINAPDWFLCAKTGTVIGHEILHALDDTGKKYDEKGRQKNWWDSESEKNFKNKTQCFIDQFNAENVNGKLTLGENIADFNGVLLAYQTYKNITAEESYIDTTLPGLEKYTTDQLFFIAYGSLWCSVNSHMHSSTDPHSPAPMRMKKVLQNLKEFNAAFNCPKNSRMNRERKCDLY